MSEKVPTASQPSHVARRALRPKIVMGASPPANAKASPTADRISTPIASVTPTAEKAPRSDACMLAAWSTRLASSASGVGFGWLSGLLIEHLAQVGPASRALEAARESA